MANPAATARVAPGGKRLRNGYPAKFAFAIDPDVSLFERSCKPPGITNGDAIDTSTQHEADWNTKAPRGRNEMKQATYKGGYDPDMVNQILALCGQEGAITHHHPDGSAQSFFGYLQDVEFDDQVEGTFPECTFVIQPTNWDPVNDVEAGFVMTSVAGT